MFFLQLLTPFLSAAEKVQQPSCGLGWTGLDWVGMGLALPDWVKLSQTGFDRGQAESNWVRLGKAEPDWAKLTWTGPS